MPIAGHRWMLVADERVQPLDPKLSPELARGSDRYGHFEPAAWPKDELRAESTKASFIQALQANVMLSFDPSGPNLDGGNATKSLDTRARMSAWLR